MLGPDDAWSTSMMKKKKAQSTLCFLSLNLKPKALDPESLSLFKLYFNFINFGLSATRNILDQRILAKIGLPRWIGEGLSP